MIATGSHPVAPTIEGLREGEYLTNETVFSLTELPRKLVVLGGGPMGSELAQAFRRLGSEVDLVHSRNTLLPKDEPEAGEVLRRRFERQGVRLHFGFRAVRAANGRLTVQSQSETRELEYDKLLLGIGRKANVEEILLQICAGFRSRSERVEDVDQYTVENMVEDVEASGVQRGQGPRPAKRVLSTGWRDNWDNDYGN